MIFIGSLLCLLFLVSSLVEEERAGWETLTSVYRKPRNDSLAGSEGPDELHHYAAFHQGQHCLLR